MKEKVTLTIDMPFACFSCPVFGTDGRRHWCKVTGKYVGIGGRHKDCPLKPVANESEEDGR